MSSQMKLECDAAWFFGLLEDASDLIQAVDQDGRFLYVNQAWKTALGYSDDEINTVTLWDVIDPRSQEHCRSVFGSILNGEDSGQIEAVLLSKSGAQVFVEGSASPYCREGKFIATRGIFRNVNERRRVEEELRKSEDLYRLITDHSTDMISKHTPEGVYTFVSDACERLLGYDKEELIGTSAYNYYHPDDLARILHSHYAIIERSDLLTVSYRIRKKNGEYCWFETTSRMARNEITGEVEEMIAMSRDVSERVNARVALAERENRLSAIINMAVDAIITFDVRGLIESSNPAAEKLFGYSNREIQGQSVLMLIPEEETGKHEGYIQSCLKGGKPSAINVGKDTIGVKKNGAAFPIHLSLSDMELAEKRHFTAIIHDISERVRLENELRNLAIRDPLTSLYNRRHFMSILHTAMQSCVRYEMALALCMCDVDDFKAINDKYGHNVGDQVLVMLSEVIKRELRPMDIASRHGGDELVILFPNTTAENAAIPVERIRHKLEKEQIATPDGLIMPVSGTFGIAGMDSKFARPEDFIEAADMALYEGKRIGKNRVVVLVK